MENIISWNQNRTGCEDCNKKVCYPVAKECREKLYKEILSTYEWELQRKENENRKQDAGHLQQVNKGKFLSQMIKKWLKVLPPAIKNI